jgi:hypothetical protein
MGGLVAAVVFWIAHGIFLAWVLPPAVFGGVVGLVGGAVCGPAIRRSEVQPGKMAMLLVLTALPLGLAAFVVSPVIGDTVWLVRGAVIASVVTGGLCGVALRSGWWGILALAAVGFLVAGPGEPYVHEGPEPRIIGFYVGLVAALAASGAVAAVLVLRAAAGGGLLPDEGGRPRG